MVFGFLAGPTTGLIDPDALFGHLLFPLVSLAVALILFEGGLSLRLSELSQIGSIVRNLNSVGALLGWIVSTLAGVYVLGLNIDIALLLGATLIVTGPTVVLPMLRHIRPSGRVGSILKWEGIVIDPVGATAAVLTFEALTSEMAAASSLAVYGVVQTVVIGSFLGFVGARFLLFFLQRHLIPDHLQNAATLMLVLLVFTCSNVFQAESGLLTVTLMGIILANQSAVSVKHIVEFKENLRVLLISSIFIILVARLELSDLQMIDWRSFCFLGILLFVARPMVVWVSSIGSNLTWREKLFLSWLAPRGIVAAAVASVFSLRMVEMGYPQAEVLAPMVFFVIAGTVAIYSLTSPTVARLLGISKPHPQGPLIVGAHPFSRAIAKALRDSGIQILLVDTSRYNVAAAAQEGLRAYYGNVLSDQVMQDLNFGEIGRVIAFTPNDAVNSLACLHFLDVFGRAECYQLAPEVSAPRPDDEAPTHLRGRILFDEAMTYQKLQQRWERGAELIDLAFDDEEAIQKFLSRFEERATPLFIITENKRLLVVTADLKVELKVGQRLIALVDQPEGVRS